MKPERPVIDPRLVKACCNGRQDINGHGVLVRQNDQVYCRRCGKTWDVTDPDPPKCKTGDDWIKEIRKMLYNSEK